MLSSGIAEPGSGTIVTFAREDESGLKYLGAASVSGKPTTEIARR